MIAHNRVGYGRWARLDCSQAAPSGAHQYAEVQKIAGIAKSGKSYNMKEFIAEKFPSNTRHSVSAPYQYLTWSDDNCSLGPAASLRWVVQRVTGFGNEFDPRTLTTSIADLVRYPFVPKAPFKHGCWRHDFAWRNLSRIEQKFPTIDSWNKKNYDATNAKLLSDWYDACDNTYTNALYRDFKADCRLTADDASDLLKLVTSVSGYRSNMNDIGYQN